MTTAALTTPRFDIAAKVAHRFEIRGVAFMSLRVVPIGSDNGTGDLGFEIKQSRVLWGGDGSTVRVLVPTTITVYREADGQRIEFMEVEVHTRAEYAILDGTLSDEDITHFAGMNGFLHVWPYVRAEVQSLTAKVGLPPLLLPLVMASGVPALVVDVRKAAAPAPPPKQGSAKKASKKRAK